MKKIAVIVALLISVQVCFAQNNLVKETILDGKVELLIPRDFKWVQNPENVKSYLLSGENGTVTLEYEPLQGTMTDNDIPAYTDVLISEMKQNKMPYTFLEDGIYLQDGKNIGYIKFSMEVAGKKTFRHIFYISVNEKLLFFAFSCPLKEQKKWEANAAAIANSLRVTATE